MPFRLTDLPRRNLAVADKWPSRTAPPRPKVIGPTLYPAHGSFTDASTRTCLDLCPYQWLASSERKGSTTSQESCSWSILESFISLLSLDPRCPFLPCPPPRPLHPAWLGGKKQMVFSRKAAQVPSPPPFSPPFAFRSFSTAVAMATVQSWLAAACRPQIQHLGIARVVGLALVPVLFTPMGHAWHMLHRRQDVLVMLREADQGTLIIFPTPYLLGSFPDFRAQALSAAPGPRYLLPWVLQNGALQRTHSLSSPPPTSSQDSKVDWGW